jgi:predicted adenylyl cyclase CyaB
MRSTEDPRIHLDEVRGLGTFSEIEVVLDDSVSAAEGEREARELMVALGIPESALVTPSYLDLLEERFGSSRSLISRHGLDT